MKRITTDTYKYCTGGNMREHSFMLYGLVRGIKPKRILEIGVGGLVSGKAMMNAIKDANLACEYHGCDINPDCLALINRFETVDRTFYNMTSNELAKEWNLPLDILLIDGDHSYEQTKIDYENFYPYVNKDGYIIFHDTCPPTEKHKKMTRCGTVYKILDDLYMNHNLEVVTFTYSYGLTVCRKLT